MVTGGEVIVELTNTQLGMGALHSVIPTSGAVMAAVLACVEAKGWCVCVCVCVLRRGPHFQSFILLHSRSLGIWPCVSLYVPISCTTFTSLCMYNTHTIMAEFTTVVIVTLQDLDTTEVRPAVDLSCFLVDSQLLPSKNQLCNFLNCLSG